MAQLMNNDFNKFSNVPDLVSEKLVSGYWYLYEHEFPYPASLNPATR